jgi:hypothetical protein
MDERERGLTFQTSSSDDLCLLENALITGGVVDFVNLNAEMPPYAPPTRQNVHFSALFGHFGPKNLTIRAENGTKTHAAKGLK